MRRFFRGYIHVFGSIASTIGLILIFVFEPWRGTIALAVVVVFLSAVLAQIIITLNRYARAKYPRGFSTISQQVRYSTLDGNKVRYEVYRHVQCRQAWMTELPYPFKWSGSKPPIITSDFQTVGPIRKGAEGEYDEFQLQFKEPLLYGQTAVVHFVMELDDSDHASLPHVEMRVSEPLQLLVWRVELKHAPRTFREPANLYRVREGVAVPKPESLGVTPFIESAMAYEHFLPNPAPGYSYGLDWKRPRDVSPDGRKNSSRARKRVQ